MSETSSKKRLAITISSLCIAVVAVICSVVAIFAAANQGVQSTFRVTYKATNVAATVSAKYTVKNESAVNLGSLTIDAAADETTYNSLSTDEDISLSAKNNEVVFQYTFTNNSSSNSIVATLVDGADQENVTVQYAQATSADAELTYASSLGEVNIPADGTVYVYIKVTISNTANDAHYIADATNKLIWSLEAVTTA